jgi:hypothetical protein
MQKQSSRAEISAWEFTNEYQYGDFRGNALEMLRRGYDVHLHYANFGIRKLLIRLPQGLPNAQAAAPFLETESFVFHKDPEGPGGSLELSPNYEPGDLEDLWDLAGRLDDIAGVRAEILGGDLRPLYIAHLVASRDMEHDRETTMEAPVPAGLARPTKGQLAVAALYEIDESIIAAAAQESQERPPQGEESIENWVKSQSNEKKNEWLTQWLLDRDSTARMEMLAEFRSSKGAPVWPTTPPSRTIAQLEGLAEKVHEESKRKAASSAASKRKRLLAKIAADPTPYLKQTEDLVIMRSSENYRRIAEILADVREALAETAQNNMAGEQAAKLTRANPTLGKLKTELRRKGLLPK